jgi:hypothetical protein
MPSDRRLGIMQKLMDAFVVGNLNISKKRLYLKPNFGGLGLFDLNIFLTAQQSNWIVKAEKSVRDN